MSKMACSPTKKATDTDAITFEDFDLSRELLKGIYEKGWRNPSPLQESCFPFAFSGKNLLVRAKNGSGKTGAYCIPILKSVDIRVKFVQAMVLVPNKEMAVQTSGICSELAKHMNVKILAASDENVKIKVKILLHGVHIIFATPNRMFDIIRKGVNMNHCKILVLDEVDKLLTLSCNGMIDLMIQHIKLNQILLYLSSSPTEIRTFIEKRLGYHYHINIPEEFLLEDIVQMYMIVKKRNKIQRLNILFTKLQVNQSIIFCNTCYQAELLSNEMSQMGYSTDCITSHVPLYKRNQLYCDFKTGLIRNLVCSDFMVRAIDVQWVNVIINFDFPKSPETYLHRIGRARHLGRVRFAISLVTYEDIHALQHVTRTLENERRPIPIVL